MDNLIPTDFKKLSKEEKNRIWVKANYYKNKEKKLQAIMKYRAEHPDKYRDYHRAYYHLKLKPSRESNIDIKDDLDIKENIDI